MCIGCNGNLPGLPGQAFWRWIGHEQAKDVFIFRNLDDSNCRCADGWNHHHGALLREVI